MTSSFNVHTFDATTLSDADLEALNTKVGRVIKERASVVAQQKFYTTWGPRIGKLIADKVKEARDKGKENLPEVLEFEADRHSLLKIENFRDNPDMIKFFDELGQRLNVTIRAEHTMTTTNSMGRDAGSDPDTKIVIRFDEYLPLGADPAQLAESLAKTG